MSHLFFIADSILNKSDVNIPKSDASPATLQNTLTIAFVVIGALALLMMVISGLRYVVSQGDPQKVAEVKRQMVYSLVGLVVAASAAAAVNFILGKF